MKSLITMAVVALVGATSWFAWFAWDHTYYVDSKTGLEAGPYQTWQGVGSAIMVIAVVVIAVRFASPMKVALAAATGYAFGWGWTSMPGDESGMSGVGLVMVLIGVFVGTFLVGLVTDQIWEARKRGGEPGGKASIHLG
ncbi:MAG: hypothetical protein ABIR57_04905 [Aeromicrobium sp.]